MFGFAVSRRSVRKGMAAAVVAASAMALPQPSTANAAVPCGNWWPGSGTIFGRHIPATPEKTYNEFVLRTTFTFSPQEVAALRCTKSRSLEVDVEAYGGMDGGLKGMTSNLPGAYLDTEQFDGKKSRVLTVGSQSAAEILSGVEYYSELRLSEFGIKDGKNYAELYLNFQRGHWASSLDEKAFCVAKGGPENCINPDESRNMQSALGTDPRVEFQNYPVLASGTWGSYRRSELRPGDRINSGDQLYSPDGKNRLVMQSDGNLVEYASGHVAWETATSIPESVVVAQPDGNLVIVAPRNQPVWSSNVRVAGTVYQLQNDRNFVGYSPGHRANWQSGHR